MTAGSAGAAGSVGGHHFTGEPTAIAFITPVTGLPPRCSRKRSGVPGPHRPPERRRPGGRPHAGTPRHRRSDQPEAGRHRRSIAISRAAIGIVADSSLSAAATSTPSRPGCRSPEVASTVRSGVSGPTPTRSPPTPAVSTPSIRPTPPSARSSKPMAGRPSAPMGSASRPRRSRRRSALGSPSPRRRQGGGARHVGALRLGGLHRRRPDHPIQERQRRVHRNGKQPETSPRVVRFHTRRGDNL